MSCLSRGPGFIECLVRKGHIGQHGGYDAEGGVALMDLRFVTRETAMATTLGLLIGCSLGLAALAVVFEKARSYYETHVF